MFHYFNFHNKHVNVGYYFSPAQNTEAQGSNLHKVTCQWVVKPGYEPVLMSERIHLATALLVPMWKCSFHHSPGLKDGKEETESTLCPSEFILSLLHG